MNDDIDAKSLCVIWVQSLNQKIINERKIKLMRILQCNLLPVSSYHKSFSSDANCIPTLKILFTVSCRSQSCSSLHLNKSLEMHRTFRQTNFSYIFLPCVSLIFFSSAFKCSITLHYGALLHCTELWWVSAEAKKEKKTHWTLAYHLLQRQWQMA